MPTQDHFDDTGDPRSWGAVPVKADPPVKFDDLPDASWLDYQRPPDWARESSKAPVKFDDSAGCIPGD